MARKEDIVYSVGMDTTDVDKGVKKSNKKVKELGTEGEKSLSQLNSGATLAVGGLAALAAGAVVLAGSVKLVSDGIQDFNVQARAENKLESVLKSTKNVAGLTAYELKQMASGLQEVTTIGDETTIAAQSMLLTFTKIGKEVIPQATEAAMNMSHIMGGGLEQNIKMVGKSLNDLGGAGLTAMTRSGVQFTDQQEKMIKALARSGKEMEAQKIVLAELEVQFGGAARNFRNTFEGMGISISNIFGDLSEKIGEGFAEETTGELRDLLQSLTDASPELQSLAKSFGSIAGSLASIPINALTGWTDLFHAYSAGSDASLKNPLLKTQAEAQTELNKAIQFSISPLKEEEILKNFGGISGIRSLFLSAEKGDQGSIRTIAINKELQAVYNATKDEAHELNKSFKAVNEAIQKGTLNELTKESKKTPSAIKPVKVTWKEVGRSDTLNLGENYESDYDRTLRLDKDKANVSEQRRQEQLKIEADNRAMKEQELSNQIAFYDNSTALIQNSENAILGVHQIWASESTDILLKGMSNLTNSTNDMLQNVGSLTGNQNLQAGSSLIGGLGLLSAGLSAASLISSLVSGGGQKQQYERGSDTLNTSASQSRASIISNAPENVYNDINNTFVGCIGTDSELKVFGDKLAEVQKKATYGVN